ncbi:FAD/NAD(P)-binding domain-containing protein [Aspergillus heteromorphus CBS 117.55]|uniref:FAD/NAD(P)-binding domain-containing protein n=1 Tax=Aspergillus heteromorphus CBS 117.55 TaxID=1448321 RepID=A0A317WRB1_9EURO|nr:FAD/NAD(P)-binding domain-containing protein [Aspergillus heteromorphus CBS 117.55]PWY87657.1 FAD/NAD(P)-binding domain-containing protein [Aspergillus heteromorphus CBS 117.55]
MPLFQSERVAVIGGGCTGITSFWALQNSVHDVHLFEASADLGGRVKTLPFEHNGNQVDVNTESPTFNAEASPNLVSLLRYLGITTSQAQLCFGATEGTCNFQWCGSVLKSILLRPWALCSLETYRILSDIIWLRYLAVDVLSTKLGACKTKNVLQSLSAHDYLSGEGYSNNFRNKYLAPMLSMLWSTNAGKFLPQLPVRALVQCLCDHQLLKPRQVPPDWRCIKPGTSQLVHTMSQHFPASKVHLKSRVVEVIRHGKNQYGVLTSDGQEMFFNHIIFAVNGPETIKILGSHASLQEKDIIQGLGSTRNISVLHSDPLLMPEIDTPGPSCNYILASDDHHRFSQSIKDPTAHISSLSYIANSLESIPEYLFGPVYITLNPFTPPHPSHVQGVWEFADPEPSANTLVAQSRLPSIQNKRGLSYAFCWTGRGHLEDAVTAGLRLAIDHLGAKVPFEVQYHQDPLDAASSLPPRIGLKDNLVRTILRLISVYLLIFELVLVGLRALRNPASRRNSRRIEEEEKTETASGATETR